MRGIRNAACLLLLAGAPVLGAAPPAAPPPRQAPVRAEVAAPVIVAPEKVDPYKMVRVKVQNAPAGNFIFFDVFPMDGVDFATQRLKSELEFVAPPGTYKVRVRLAKNPDAPPVDLWHTVTIGGTPAPPGPGPNPPGPQPDPNPPAPEGFRVIFVYESSQALTPAVQQVMYGEKVRQYLDAKAKGWRRFDKDVDASNERDADVKALWQAARPKVTAVPCVIVAVGGKAEIIPFPAGEDEALTILKRYGG